MTAQIQVIHVLTTQMTHPVYLCEHQSWTLLPSAGELVTHITTSTNTMSEILSQELSYLMWYISRLAFLLFFMLTQSWKMLLLTLMGLPICWVVATLTGSFQEVQLFPALQSVFTY